MIPPETARTDPHSGVRIWTHAELAAIPQGSEVWANKMDSFDVCRGASFVLGVGRFEVAVAIARGVSPLVARDAIQIAEKLAHTLGFDDERTDAAVARLVTLLPTGPLTDVARDAARQVAGTAVAEIVMQAARSGG